jgi:hypothetical protein
MLPYGSYQQYQIERPKSREEIVRANQQLGELSRTVSSVWRQATRPAGALLAHASRRRPRVQAHQKAQSHVASLSEPVLAEAQSTAAVGSCDRVSARC